MNAQKGYQEEDLIDCPEYQSQESLLNAPTLPLLVRDNKGVQNHNDVDATFVARNQRYHVNPKQEL